MLRSDARPLFLVLVCVPLLLSACTKPRQEVVRRPKVETEVELRTRSAAFLWDTLQRSDPFTEVNERIEPFEKTVLKTISGTTTRREYLVALALALSQFSDPHIQFANLQEWWKQKEGKELVLGCCAFPAGGYHWIAFDQACIDLRKGQSAPPSQQFYQLLSIEGIPVGTVADTLLWGEPGSVIQIEVLSLDGTPYAFGLRVPKTPFMIRAEIKNLPTGFSPTPILGFFHGTLGPHGVVSMPVGRIGYISLANVDDDETIKAFDQALDALYDTRALILDLRWNPGGLMWVTASIIGRFVPNVTPYALHLDRTRPVVSGRELPIWYSSELKAKPRKPVYRKPLVILMDTSTFSGGEILAFALKDVRHAVLIGNSTLGGGAALGCVTLPDGLEVWYSKNPIRRLAGIGYQYVGVTPDIAIELDRAAMCSRGMDAFATYNAELFNRALSEAERLATKWAGLPATQPATQSSTKAAR